MTGDSTSRLVIDVGANEGAFAMDIAERNPSLRVLAFEPIPHLCERILASSAQRKLNNLDLLRLAVDVDPRQARFHVAGQGDFGVSSLLGFDEEQIQKDEYWKGRKDLCFDSEIEVSVVRLDSLEEVRRAQRICFIKIDAQGVDLPALESLGDLLPKVEAGMLEVPATLESKLYAGEAHDLHSATARLLELGFRVYAIKPNDHASREFNLYFCRKDVDWRAVEESLKLRGVHLYDGKHFWHSPADHLLPDSALADQQRILDRLALVESSLARECAETRRLNDALALKPTTASAAGTGPTYSHPSNGPLSSWPRPGEFDVRSELARGGRVFWAGAQPPLLRMDADPRIYDPDSDYRLPAQLHQTYDYVYLVERDLGTQKAWPLVVDEALRLLRPGGVLVVRMTNTALCSIYALKHFIGQWGGWEPVFEFQCEDGATEFGVRNQRTEPRPAGCKSFSIGVITDGKRRERLYAFLESVCLLEKAGVEVVELLVCAPASVRSDVLAAFPGVVFVVDEGGFPEQGWITRKKNLLVDRATQENVVIVHDRYTLAPDFLQSIIRFGGDFSLIVCRQLRPDGRRFPDWVSLGTGWSWSSPAMLRYGDWTPYLYVNGGITIGKTEVLRSIRWNELLFWNQAEDVELTRRLMGRGYVARLAREAVAISHLTRAGTMEAFELLPTVSECYHLPGPPLAAGEEIAPSLPLAQTIRLSSRLVQNPGRLGFFYCEQWALGQDALELGAGVFGEVGGRLPATPSVNLEVRFGCTVSVGLPEVIVNDVPIIPKVQGRELRLSLPPKLFAQTRVVRMHFRISTGSLRFTTFEMLPDGWDPGMRLPVTRERVLGLLRQPRVLSSLDGSSLALVDLRLLARGARQISVFLPSPASAARSWVPFLGALRAHSRPDASLQLVGHIEGLATPEGYQALTVDWDRYEKDAAYRVDRDAAFNSFGSELIINACSPRQSMPDVMIAESPCLGVIGFDAAPDDLHQECFVTNYTRLLPTSGDPVHGLCRALGIVANFGPRSTVS